MKIQHFLSMLIFAASSFLNASHNPKQKWKPVLFSVDEKNFSDKKQLASIHHFKSHKIETSKREVLPTVERVERGSLKRKAEYMNDDSKSPIDPSDFFDFKSNSQ